MESIVWVIIEIAGFEKREMFKGSVGFTECSTQTELPNNNLTDNSGDFIDNLNKTLKILSGKKSKWFNFYFPHTYIYNIVDKQKYQKINDKAMTDWL
jgi:hypothetical protein